jgi:hypothetical protein
MFEVEVSVQVQDVFREYCLAFCRALRPVDIARGFQAQAPRPVEPVPLGALISAPPVPNSCSTSCPCSTQLGAVVTVGLRLTPRRAPHEHAACR